MLKIKIENCNFYDNATIFGSVSSKECEIKYSGNSGKSSENPSATSVNKRNKRTRRK